MTVCVGMHVHRKCSQVAIIDEAGDQQRNRNVGNDPTKLVPVVDKEGWLSRLTPTVAHITKLTNLGTAP
jgi:hypothetical protein